MIDILSNLSESVAWDLSVLDAIRMSRKLDDPGNAQLNGVRQHLEMYRDRVPVEIVDRCIVEAATMLPTPDGERPKLASEIVHDLGRLIGRA